MAITTAGSRAEVFATEASKFLELQRENYNSMLTGQNRLKRACSVPLTRQQGFARDIPDLSSLKQELLAESGRFKERRPRGTARPRERRPSSAGTRSARCSNCSAPSQAAPRPGNGHPRQTGRSENGRGLGPVASLTDTSPRGDTREGGVPERRIHTQAHASLHRLRETPRRPTQVLV